MSLILAFAAFLPVSPTFARASCPPQHVERSETEFVATGPFHRVILPANSPALARLRAAGAVVWVEDYGSFALACVDERRAERLEALRAAGLQLADQMTLVEFNGYELDGADPKATAAARAGIPEILRAPTDPPANGESRLKLVQFIGPPKDAWLDALRRTGAFVVTYAASNAYVVKVDARANASLDLYANNAYVLSSSNYEPAFKLRPELRPSTLADTGIYDVMVQVIADDTGSDFVESLGARAFAVLSEADLVLNYINIGVRLDGANVIDLAQDSHVFAIEPLAQPELLDECQGQIVAGNCDVAGVQPAGPSYLAWLASIGLPESTPFAFSVDVVDTGIDRGEPSTVRASVSSSGAEANHWSQDRPSVSGNGRYVAFESRASNLVPGDTNGTWDVFVFDRETGITERVSVDSAGAQWDRQCGGPALSGDGRYVAFHTVPPSAPFYYHVYVRDRLLSTTELDPAPENRTSAEITLWVERPRSVRCARASSATSRSSES